jgi:polyisoprenoid-binding protein YceI
MKQLLLIVCCFSFQLLGAQTWQQQSGKVSFKISNAGITVDGYFEDSPVISFVYPNQSKQEIKLTGSVAVAGIKTGIGIRDKHLLRSDYFDVVNFPTISMMSQTITGRGNNLRGRFLLSIKGISKPVEMDIQLQENGGTISMTGSFTINRQDYKVGGESLILSDEVSIKVEAVFVKT